MSADNTNAEEALNSIQKDVDDVEAQAETDLLDVNYPKLMNVARSARENHDAEIDTDAPKKDNLVAEMASEGIFRGPVGDEGFYIVKDDDSAEEIELLDVQTNQGSSSSGSQEPKDKTVLYCLTRAETTEDRVAEIEEALKDSRFDLRGAAGDKYSIVLPAEEDYEQEHLFEEDDEEESEDQDDDDDEGDVEYYIVDDDDEVIAGPYEDYVKAQQVNANKDGEVLSEDDLDYEADESDSDEAQSESSDEGDDGEGDEPESTESESEADESEDDEDELISYDVAKERYDEKTYDELYEIAQERDISGRSDMDSDELVEAILEDNDNVADE